MAEILELMNQLVWGIPALVGILGVGIYLTIRTNFVQVKLFPNALGRFLRMFRGRDKSSFRSLCTALGATVGTGNLVGVAGAICLGGPGAVFWMWVCGFLGMATKYTEVVLAVHYRTVEKGEILGGPMYIISRGMGKKWQWMAGVYCFLGVIAAFGVGNATQINAMLSAFEAASGYESRLLPGIFIAMAVGLLLCGGAKRIGAAAEKLVPIAAGCYVVLCVSVLLLRHDRVGWAFCQILRGAFNPKAVTGGMIGAAFSALRVGCARGVFTNEAGMGTASIAHAGAEVKHPCDQGLMGIVEVFLDTIVICTLTALVILTSGVEIPYGMDGGGQLTSLAFRTVCGEWAAYFLSGALACFAFATILGWGLYGLRCASFLFGPGAEKWFVLLQMAAAVLGALLGTGIIWQLAELVNGLMAIPNLIALSALSSVAADLTTAYVPSRRKKGYIQSAST